MPQAHDFSSYPTFGTSSRQTTGPPRCAGVVMQEARGLGVLDALDLMSNDYTAGANPRRRRPTI